MSKIKVNKAHFATYFSLAVIVCLVIVFTLMESSFVNSANLNNLLSDTAPLMIMAAGMTPVILLGSIDLSVGSLCSVANVMVLSIIMQFKDSIYLDWFIMFVSFFGNSGVFHSGRYPFGRDPCEAENTFIYRFSGLLVHLGFCGSDDHQCPHLHSESIVGDH